MERLDEFRIYYNHTVHPELVRMELKRKKLLRLLLLSTFLLSVFIGVELYIGVLLVALIGAIPIFFYISWLIYQVQKFRRTFKPNVVKLLLDFLDDRLNYGEFRYDAKKYVSKNDFMASQIFTTSANIYQGEDYITGSIGNLEFELCEIRVQDTSPVDSSLRDVFKGIFLRSSFDVPVQGKLLVIPRKQKQFLERSVKKLIASGGRKMERTLWDSVFEEMFVAYTQDGGTRSWISDSGTILAKDILSTEMQKSIADYCKTYRKQIYFSVIDQEIYLFLTEPKDFLEPYFFRSNVSFELVKEFFEDVELVIKIIEEFDRFY
ncbi:MAG: DUF3137 domain-containing protein [Bacteroidota bacterium]